MRKSMPARRRDAEARRITKAARALLKTAADGAALAELAALEWAKVGERGACPANRIPSAQQLAAAAGAAPGWRASDAARGAGREWLRRLFPGAAWIKDDDGGLAAAHPPREGERAPHMILTHAAAGLDQLKVGDRVGLLAVRSLADISAAWAVQAGREDAAGHPVAPLVADWQKGAPVRVRAEVRADKQILPGVTGARAARLAIAGGGPHPAREQALLALGVIPAADARAPELPLWERAADPKRVLALDFVTGAGRPFTPQGRGAPLGERFAHRLLMAAPINAAPGRRMEFRVRVADLARKFWPGYRPSRHWPMLRAAMAEVNGAYIALPDGGEWAPIRVWRRPGAGGALSDFFTIEARLPDGVGDGPAVDLPSLDKLGRDSPARYRAYLAAHALAWRPGRTRRRVPGADWWAWSRNQDDYLVLTAEDRRRLAFGLAAMNRTKAQIDAAFEALPGLVVVSKNAQDLATGEVGWLVVPEDAASAIKRGRAAGV